MPKQQFLKCPLEAGSRSESIPINLQVQTPNFTAWYKRHATVSCTGMCLLECDDMELKTFLKDDFGCLFGPHKKRVSNCSRQCSVSIFVRQAEMLCIWRCDKLTLSGDSLTPKAALRLC